MKYGVDPGQVNAMLVCVRGLVNMEKGCCSGQVGMDKCTLCLGTWPTYFDKSQNIWKRLLSLACKTVDT